MEESMRYLTLYALPCAWLVFWNRRNRKAGWPGLCSDGEIFAWPVTFARMHGVWVCETLERRKRMSGARAPFVETPVGLVLYLAWAIPAAFAKWVAAWLCAGALYCIFYLGYSRELRRSFKNGARNVNRTDRQVSL
jgi:hypothetical protein